MQVANVIVVSQSNFFLLVAYLIVPGKVELPQGVIPVVGLFHVVHDVLSVFLRFVFGRPVSHTFVLHATSQKRSTVSRRRSDDRNSGGGGVFSERQTATLLMR